MDLGTDRAPPVERPFEAENFRAFDPAVECYPCHDFEVGEVLTTAANSDTTPIERSSMNSWDDARFVAAIKASGMGALRTELIRPGSAPPRACRLAVRAKMPKAPFRARAFWRPII
jgi:hypothetical protein